MKTLKLWLVVTVMLAVCAPSFGYVLVYNVISRVRAIDNDAETMVGTAVRGYLFMDFNDTTGDLNEAQWLTFGKDSSKTLVYTMPDDPSADLSVNGRFQSISMLTGDGWTVMVVGKITSKNIGLTDKQLIAYTMSGNFTVDGGTVFNGDMFNGDIITGSGSMTITLNTIKTKAANQASDSIDDVVNGITDAFDTLGYTGI